MCEKGSTGPIDSVTRIKVNAQTRESDNRCDSVKRDILVQEVKHRTNKSRTHQVT